MAGIWDELGIPPTAEEGVIRRAYAAGLKGGRGPNDDPAAFARLRAAYEGALRHARALGPNADALGPAGTEPLPPDAVVIRASDLPEPTAPPGENRWQEANEFMAHLRSCLDTHDGPSAAAALQAWIRCGADRPLDVSEMVEYDLFKLLDEPGTPPEVLAALGDAYGEEFGDIRFAQRHPALHGLLPVRVEAALWLRKVRRIAAADPPDAAPGHPSRVAAALLGPPGAVPRRALDWKHHPLLRELLPEARFWQPHLRWSLDSTTLQRLQCALDGVNWLGFPVPLPAGLLRASLALFVWGWVLLAGMAGVDAGLAGHNGRFPPPDMELGALEPTVQQRVELRLFGPDTLIYFSNLLTCRGALTRIRYGVDTRVPDRDFPLAPLDRSAPVCGPIPRNTPLYATVPGTVAFVSVEVTWADGVRSGVEVIRYGPARPRR